MSICQISQTNQHNFLLLKVTQIILGRVDPEYKTCKSQNGVNPKRTLKNKLELNLISLKGGKKTWSPATTAMVLPEIEQSRAYHCKSRIWNCEILLAFNCELSQDTGYSCHWKLKTNLNFIFNFLTFDPIPESQSLVNPSQGEESSWRRARLCRRRRSGRGSGRAPPSRTLVRERAARIGTSICSPWWVGMSGLVQGEGRVESCRGQWRWKWGRDPLAGERNLPGNDNTGHGMIHGIDDMCGHSIMITQTRFETAFLASETFLSGSFWQWRWNYIKILQCKTKSGETLLITCYST